MATILDAVRGGILEEFALPQWEMREPIRPLYVAPQLFDWVDSKAELFDQNLAVAKRIRVEHLEQMFGDFRCSPRPGGGDLRRVTPTRSGVWKMHPPGLRVYGWFCAPRRFVAVAAALVEETKVDKALSDVKRAEVLAFARKHGLAGTILMGDIRAILHS